MATASLDQIVKKASGLRTRGRTAEAVAILEEAAARHPGSADVYYELGKVSAQLANMTDAIDLLKTANALAADRVDIRHDLALYLRRAGRLQEAEAIVLQLVSERPKDPMLWSMLGAVFGEQGRGQDAFDCFRYAVELAPRDPSARNNLATVLTMDGQYEAAVEASREAARLAPDNAQIRFNLGISLLTIGALEEGWREYDRRVEQPEFKPLRPHLTGWNGADLAGKSVLIAAEQGIADEIMFATCFAEVVARARRTVIECDERLIPIFARTVPGAEYRATTKRNDFKDRVADYSWVKAAGPFDVVILAGSLPRRLRPTLADFPRRDATLVADPAKRAHWRRRLDDLGAKPKVGIAWTSRNATGAREQAFAPLDAWRQVFGMADVTFVNVQYTVTADDLTPAGEGLATVEGGILHFTDLDLMRDLDGSLALLAELDLVVGPSNATMNLAAAAGTETWSVIPVFGWPLLGTKAFPWFPRTRTFARAEYPDWHALLADVAARLRERLGI